MGLVMPYQLTDDIILPKAYFRIVEIKPILQSDEMRHMPIKVFGYYSKQARENNSMDYFKEFEFCCFEFDEWFGDESISEKNHIEIAYEFLKTLPEFENAIDEIEGNEEDEKQPTSTN